MGEEAIKKVIAAFADARNSHDMDAWGKLFVDDTDFVNRGGGWWKSNRENVEGHRAIHEMLARRKQEMNFRLSAAKISFLKPDIAIVHATSEWPGSAAPPGANGDKGDHDDGHGEARRDVVNPCAAEHAG